VRLQRWIALQDQRRNAADIGGGKRSARRDLVLLVGRRQEDVGAGGGNRDVVAAVRSRKQLFLRVGAAHRNHVRIGGGIERRRFGAGIAGGGHHQDPSRRGRGDAAL